MEDLTTHDETSAPQAETKEKIDGKSDSGEIGANSNKNNEDDTRTRNVAVSIEDDKTSGPNSSGKSPTNISTVSLKDKLNERGNVDSSNVTKSTSGDNQASLGASSIFYTDTTVLGASTTSLASISSSATNPYRPAPPRHRRITGYIDENDLSTPYNHYRCLSPNEQYGKSHRFYFSFLHTLGDGITFLCLSRFLPTLGRSTGSRFLKRQFSLDRPDDAICASFIEQTSYQQQQRQQQQQNLNTPRLYKQNSAGAANDLERIEEVPSTPAPLLQHYRQAASVSLSVESLTLR